MLNYDWIFRYNAQKKYAEAIDLLYNGALVLLKHDQVKIFISLSKIKQLLMYLEISVFPCNLGKLIDLWFSLA